MGEHAKSKWLEAQQKKAKETPEKTARQKQLDMCDELVALQEHLTEWEVGFVSNIRGLLQRFYDLSEKQEETLVKIVKKVAEGME